LEEKPILRRFIAFTVSEILITLVIVGVIAAMTIPTLIQKQQEKQTVVALNKAYSTLSSAYTLAVQENGTPDNWGLIGINSGQGAINMLNTLAPYLNIVKNCGTNANCWKTGTYTDINNNIDLNFDSDVRFAKAELSDGSFINILIQNPNCTGNMGASISLQTVCADIWIDINGDKKPNKIGVDLFLFWISKVGITPLGTKMDVVVAFNTVCNKTSNVSHNGSACAAWVIYNENLDYLHCNDLAWDGKTKCD